MRGASVAQPDITLVLDLEGVIREASLSGEVYGGCVDGWIGRPWTETVADIGVDKVRSMVEEACSNRVSVLSQVTQCFPDGHELLVEYTTVRLGGNAGLIAVGKSLRAVADLQARVVAAQQTMERDYWKLRNVEPRYRPLLGSSNEAELTVQGSEFEVVEANPEAAEAFRPETSNDASITGRPFLSEVSVKDREAVRAALDRVREHERAPRFLAHLGPYGEPWHVRATLVASEPRPTVRMRLSRADSRVAATEHGSVLSIENLIQRMPDGLAILDREGKILKCNSAFLDLVQVGTKRGVVGESIGQWLARPGADLVVLLSSVRSHGFVRRFETAIVSELGIETSVEISAAGDAPSEPQQIAVIVRDVSRRLPQSSSARHLGAVLSYLERQVGNATLRELVKSTVGVVERFYIEDALERTGGNRTAAAELLGMSRQSLYTKIDRYSLDGDSQTDRRAAG